MSKDEHILNRLVDALLAGTLNGKVRWQTHDRVDSFHFDGSTGSIVIRTSDRDGLPPYEFIVLNSDSQVVESLHSRDDDDEDLENSLHTLYEAARQSALDVDGTIRGLLREVEG